MQIVVIVCFLLDWVYWNCGYGLYNLTIIANCVYLNCLFFEITLGLLIDSSLPISNLKWERKPYQKKDLDKLCELSNEMNDDEINKRIRATTFPGKPGPHFID